MSSSLRLVLVGLLFALTGGAAVLAPAIASAETATTSSAGLGARTLRSGDQGPDVKQLQLLLLKAGFKTEADGVYGPGTVATVQRFQRAARLETSGVAGTVTIRRLKLATSGRAAMNSSGGFDVRGAQRTKSLGDRIPVRKGMSGHDVKVLQDYLKRAGFKTAVDGQFGGATWKTVRTFERDQELSVNGVIDANDIDHLRSLVEGDAGVAPATPTVPAPLGPGDTATVGPDGLAIAPVNAPDVVKQIIAAGNAIATKPYIYGGGHGKWNDRGYDCSGSVSYALHGAGLLDTAMPSGSFTSWGEKGPGQWVTIYAHGSHMYMVVAGLRFDTSGRREDGTRWHADMRSDKGYTVVHPPGL